VPGLWLRAGLEGAVTGLDWAGAHAQHQANVTGLEWRRVACLLRAYERGALAGSAKRQKKQTDKPELD